MKEIKTIALATDFSKVSEQAAQYARTLAKSLSARVVVVHAFDSGPPKMPAPYYLVPNITSWMEENLKEYPQRAVAALDKLCDFYAEENISCQKYFLEGQPAQQLTSFVNENSVDLVIIGSHCYSPGWDTATSAAGSVAEYIIRHTSCPVFLVKEEE